MRPHDTFRYKVILTYDIDWLKSVKSGFLPGSIQARSPTGSVGYLYHYEVEGLEANDGASDGENLALPVLIPYLRYNVSV